MAMTATITALYDALDQPDANVPLILSQLADAYEDAGDRVRARVIRWCWRKGKEPACWLEDAEPVRWDWFNRRLTRVYHWNLPKPMYRQGHVRYGHRTRSAAFLALADACAEWVERRRGRA